MKTKTVIIAALVASGLFLGFTIGCSVVGRRTLPEFERAGYRYSHTVPSHVWTNDAGHNYIFTEER